jgi:hypothetical protein
MTSHRIVVAAAALAVLSGCATSTNGTGSGGNSPSSPTSASVSVTVQPAPSAPVRTATVHAGSATYLVKIWTETTNADCAAHAYGTPVISYLKAHPCSGVTRLLATTTVNGKAVGFAQSAIGFKGTAPDVYTTAGNFRVLVTQEGTGNVNDLLREGRRLPSGPTAVPSPDAFSALGQDAGVTIVDAWYLDQPTPDNDPPLLKMAHDIFLQV